MWLHNALTAIEVQAYNEKPIVRDIGGLTKKEDYDTLNLRVTPIPEKGRFRQLETGRFWEDIFHFKVSTSELKEQGYYNEEEPPEWVKTRDSFSIQSGKTHVIVNGNDFRVVIVQDASYMPRLQLYDCIAKRMIPVDDLV